MPGHLTRRRLRFALQLVGDQPGDATLEHRDPPLPVHVSGARHAIQRREQVSERQTCRPR